MAAPNSGSWLAISDSAAERRDTVTQTDFAL